MHFFTRWYTVFVIACLLASPILRGQAQFKKLGIESHTVPEGIPVGATVTDLELDLLTIGRVSFKQLYQQGPVIIIFYRGYWCPVCNKYLKNLVDSVPILEEAGAKLIAISPNLPENVQKTQEKYESTLHFALDTSGALMQAFKVQFAVTSSYQKKIKTFLSTDIAEANGQEDAYLPVPATFIINRQGIVVWRHFDLDYHQRASPTQMYQHLPKG